jgi:hypothetical protein
MTDTLERNTAQAPTTDFSLFMLRLMGIMLVFAFLSLPLGIAFLIIAQGLIHSLIWLGLFWKPAGNILTKITGVAYPFPVFSIATIGVWRAISLTMHMAIAVALVAVGLAVLYQRGFCGQNFICMAINR